MSASLGRSVRVLALAWLASLASACSALRQPPPPIRLLDRNTGITYRVVRRPIVFAHLQPQAEAHARDYATAVGTWIDQDGDLEYVLFVYLWSTVDPRDDPHRPRDAGAITLIADDRLIRLTAKKVPASDASDVPPSDRPPVRAYTVTEFRTDGETLRYLAAAGHIELVRGPPGGRMRYSLWGDGRAALAGLIRAEGRDFP